MFIMLYVYINIIRTIPEGRITMLFS